uniref:Odorant receptor n=1 Tax=Anopheles coluzzii TaxID=1518534 RepID=A0A8W7PXK1_ANOCL
MVNLFARTPADNFRVMPYNLRLFAMLGLWGDRRKLYRLYVLLLLALNVINIAVLLMSIFIEMLCFSYLGNQLTEENANISHSAFNCRWYDEPIVIRKYFLRIILQAHRKATITAGKFYNVNIVTFAQLIKTSYTYYMIMKEMF